MTTSKIASLHFSSSALATEAQFEGWARLMSAYAASTPVPATEGFAAESTAWRLGSLILTRNHLAAHSLHRGPDQMRAEPRDNYVVIVIVDGSFELNADGRQRQVLAGETAILDAARPMRTTTTGNSSILLLVPRAELDDALPTFEVHGLVLADTSGRLFADYLVSLVRRLPEIEAAQAPRLARMTINILADVLESRRTTTPERPSRSLLARARKFIGDNLAAELTPTTIASAAGTSRSSLFTAFAALGGVSEYVTERRLQTAHRLLTSPGEERQIGAIALAVGFKSTAHFSRAFRFRFGYSPRDLRRYSAPPEPTSSEPLEQAYGKWRRQLV